MPDDYSGRSELMESGGVRKFPEVVYFRGRGEISSEGNYFL